MWFSSIQFSSVHFSRSVVSNSLWPPELQHTRPLCPSPTPGVYSNSCPLSRWCHPAISSSVVPFCSCLPILPASGSFPMSQLFAWGGQTTGMCYCFDWYFRRKRESEWFPPCVFYRNIPYSAVKKFLLQLFGIYYRLLSNLHLYIPRDWRNKLSSQIFWDQFSPRLCFPLLSWPPPLGSTLTNGPK